MGVQRGAFNELGDTVGRVVDLPVDPEMPRWRWCVPVAGRGGSVGADQKVFRGQEIDQPGDLAANKPGAKATIFVREVVQNAVDAADDLRKKLAEAGNDEVPELEVRFEFKALTGDAKASLVSGTDLVNYVDAAERAGFKELEFPDESRLVDLDDPNKPLNVLYIHERGSTGMYGSFESCESKMHLALLSVQANDKPAGAGGSFGYGKAGLVKAAGSKIVFAYSCFEATENEDGTEDDECVTRRALGVSYWPSVDNHRNESGRKFDGWGMLGDPISDELVYPFTDTDADQVAAQMGVPARSPDGTGFGGTGTVFVLIDPVVEPEDVRRAAARHWWPALENPQAQLALTVVDYDGAEIPVDPASDPFLADFIDIFHATRQVEDTSRPDIDPDDDLTEWDWMHKFRRMNDQELGRIGLRANTGWSWQSTTESGERRLTMVALVRKTGMVVEYRISGGRRISSKDPFLRGVFVADVAANDALRRTEPPLHDRWKTTPDEDEVRIEEICRAYKISDTIQNRIDEDVKAFKAVLEPPTDDSVDPVTLPILAKALSGPIGRKPPLTEEGRVEQIKKKHTRVGVPGKDQLMKVKSTYTIGLQDSVKFSEADASVKFVYNTYEDDKVGADSCMLDITAPTGFRIVPTPKRKADLVDSDGRTRVVEMPKWYEFRGKVRKGQTEEFTVVTHPFHKTWSLKPRIIYKAVNSASAAQGTEISNDANEDNG